LKAIKKKNLPTSMPLVPDALASSMYCTISSMHLPRTPVSTYISTVNYTVRSIAKSLSKLNIMS